MKKCIYFLLSDFQNFQGTADQMSAILNVDFCVQSHLNGISSQTEKANSRSSHLLVIVFITLQYEDLPSTVVTTTERINYSCSGLLNKLYKENVALPFI